MSKMKRPFAALSDDKENLPKGNGGNTDNWCSQASPVKKRNVMGYSLSPDKVARQSKIEWTPLSEKPSFPNPTPAPVTQTVAPLLARQATPAASAPAPMQMVTRPLDSTQDDGARIALSASLGSVSSDEEIVGRVEERAMIEAFLEECFVQQHSGSLYVSGSPGTGKTCSVQALARKWRRKVQGLKVIDVNCMSLPSRSVNTVLGTFCSELGKRCGSAGAGGAKNKEDALCNAIRMKLNKDKTPVLFVVDEVDQLVVGQKAGQNTLSCVLGLAKRLSSTHAPVGMIAIANAVDLLTRNLNPGRELASLECKSLLFAPYTAAQLREVITKRLSNVDEAVIDPVKLQLSVMQAAKLHGDCRKALALCKQAILETPESDLGGDGSVAPTRSLRRDGSDPSNIITQLPMEQQVILATFVVNNEGHSLKATEVRKRYTDLAKKVGLGGTPPMKPQIIEMMRTLQQRGALKVVSKKGTEPQGELTMPFEVVKEILLQANPALRREKVLQ